MSGREVLKPGDMVRPFMDLKWASSFSAPPTPVVLVKDRPRPFVVKVRPKGAEDKLTDEELLELFNNPEPIKTLKWTEVGVVLASDTVNGERWLMALFGDKFGWARANQFETLPE